MVYNYSPLREGFSVASQLNELSHQLMAQGVKALSYHITPPFYSQVSKRSSVFHFGYPEDIVATYLDPEVFESDPFPDHVMAVGHAVTWQQAVVDQKLTEKHLEFLKKAKSLGFLDGIAVPLFGPNSRNSYFSMNFERDMTVDDEEIIAPLVGIAQSCHRRITRAVMTNRRFPNGKARYYTGFRVANRIPTWQSYWIFPRRRWIPISGACSKSCKSTTAYPP